MASCVRMICTRNYQNLIIGFQVTVENVRDVFLGHSVYIATKSAAPGRAVESHSGARGNIIAEPPPQTFSRGLSIGKSF